MVIMDNLVILTFLIPDYWINDDKCQLAIITMADRGGGGDRSLDAADRTPRATKPAGARFYGDFRWGKWKFSWRKWLC